MAGEWRECRIGEIADIVGGSTPPTKDPSNFNGDIPWLTPKDLAGSHDRYISRGERNLSRKGLERCSAKLLPPGTVLVTSRAPIGYVAIAKNPIATNQGFRNLIPKPGMDSEFLYYWVKTNVEELRRHASGSTFQELTGSAFAQLRIRVPPLSEQRAIAHILGTLDDKIELNRRMSETLEQMAQAMFKAWFVDFEPVRAKMEGRWRRGESLPGLPAHLYDLFPDRLVDSELGEIPEGWEVTELGNLADIRGGKQLPTEECKPIGQYPVFGANGIMGFTERTTHDGFVIAFGRVGANCGSVHWTYCGAWINNNASSVVPKRWPEFVLQAMLITDFKDMRTGSAQPFIPNSSLSSLSLIRAPDQVLDAFCSLVRPLRLRQQASEEESRILAALRDALLPKLISGELRVKDAERFLKERGL